MGTDRLTSQHPAVAAELEQVPFDRLAEALRTVAEAAVHANGIAAECEGCPDPAALVASLDEAAWAAQETDAGETYEAAFRQARAADAWARSMTAADRESAADVLYEAVHAFGAGADAVAKLIKLMHTSTISRATSSRHERRPDGTEPAP